MTAEYLSVVSVDVLMIAYAPAARRVVLALSRRLDDPHRGRLALPGVVLRSGERLRDAALRASAKVEATPTVIGQLRTFDEPSRDPRGPSLSIAMYAVLDSPAEAPAARWAPVHEVPELPFDHNAIVATSLPIVAPLLWRDEPFTRTLVPSPFSAADALAISRDLDGVEPHRGNLNRLIDAFPRVITIGQSRTGRGRPSTLRAFG